MPLRPEFRRHTSSQDLFGRSTENTPEAYIVAHIDGGARGNPGPAGYGVVIENQEGAPIAELSCYLGRQTNNFAEYSGLLAALHYTREHGFKTLKVFSDSELLVRQINGQYKVKSPGLLPLYREARKLIESLDWCRVQHVRREQNREADVLANRAMDEGSRR